MTLISIDGLPEPTSVSATASTVDISLSDILKTPLESLRDLLLREFGGHEHFDEYRKQFRKWYCDSKVPIFDVIGRRVQFDTYPSLDDCAHVCYGGTKGHAYHSDHWEDRRADRIAWIAFALTQPTKIHPDKDDCTKEKYLLHVPKNAGAEAEHYMVIVRKEKPKVVSFLTAYDIGEDKFNAFGKVGPRVYPAPKPKAKRRR